MCGSLDTSEKEKVRKIDKKRKINIKRLQMKEAVYLIMSKCVG